MRRRGSGVGYIPVKGGEEEGGQGQSGERIGVEREGGGGGRNMNQVGEGGGGGGEGAEVMEGRERGGGR